MTREEAIEFSKYHASKSDTMIVLSDGSIYIGLIGASDILKANPDAIIIKGPESLNEFLKVKTKK